MQSLPIWLVIALAAIVLCVFGVIRSRAKKPLSPADFTREFAKRLRCILPGSRVDIKSERELRVTHVKGWSSTTFLDNAYAEYLLDPNALSAVIGTYGGSLAEFWGDDATIDRFQLVPIVKDRKWLAEIGESLKARGAEQPEGYVFDDLNAILFT